MEKAFNDWWNGDQLSLDNLFKENTPAYWAWEGWLAGVKAEREACSKICDDWTEGRDDVCLIGKAIRARINT